jgi:hypothetical protein
MRGDRQRDPSLIGAIRGPILLITIGVLFTLDHFVPNWGFDKTWPVLIIVIGLLSLMRRGLAPAPPPAPPTFPPPQYAYPQYPPPAAGGSYTQSPYSQPVPPPPAKGGFGTTAPQSAAEPQPPAKEGNPL